MAFCGRCGKDVWFPCKTLQSELSCKHKGERRESNDSSSFSGVDVDDTPTKSSGGFFSTISDAFSGSGGGYDGGSCGGGDCGGGGGGD